MFQSLLIRIRQVSQFPLVRNTLKLSSSNALMMVLPILVTPILSRLYSPADFGAWGIFASFLYIISSFLFLSYENTIVKSKNDEDVPNLVLLSLSISLLIIFGVIVVDLIAVFAGNTFFKTFPFFSLWVVLIVTTSVHTILNSIANRDKKYGVMSISIIINGLTQAILRIVLGLKQLYAVGLILGNVIAQVVTTLYLIIKLRYFFGNSFFNNIKFSEIKRLALVNKNFPLFDAPARLTEFAISHLPLIILSYYWAREDIGSISMVVTLILMPISLIGSAMGNVYYKEISTAVGDASLITSITVKAAKITFLLSLLPILSLSLGGDKLLILLLGNKWVTAGKIALCLSIYSLPVILSEPLLPIFRALDRQKVRFKLNLINLILSVGSLLVTPLFIKDLYLVLIIYASLYAIVRFAIYRVELRIGQVNLLSVSKYFTVVILFSYSVLAIRLFLFNF